MELTTPAGKKRLISIVTPCFNEEGNVRLHFERVCATIEPFRDRYDFEHIYTDNCSHDRTFELLSSLAAQHPSVRVIRFSRNIGGDRAMLFGLDHAVGDAIVLIQADLQDPPELIADFIRGWEEGNDVVFGQIQRRKEGAIIQAFRRLYYYLIARFSDVPIPQNAGDFRLTSRRVLDAVKRYQESDLYLRGIVAQIGYRQKPIPYVRAERHAGRSSVDLGYLFGYAINGLLATTVVPIRLVTLGGIVMFFLGLLFTAWLIISKLIFPDAAPHGFTTLAAMITMFSGVQILAIGIVGEYVRRTYTQTLRRPRGFIQDKVNFDA